MQIDFNLISLEQLDWFLSAAVFIVYGTICIICLIFTVSLDTYYKIDRKLNLDLLSNNILTPLDANIIWLDDWLFANHTIVGPLLIFLSLIDMKILFEIILGIRFIIS